MQITIIELPNGDYKVTIYSTDGKLTSSEILTFTEIVGSTIQLGKLRLGFNN